MQRNLFRFRDFPVYKATRIFRKELKQFSLKQFPTYERYILINQLWRALDSILLNIAEGSRKRSDLDFSRFLNIALASLDEVVSCLDAALDDEYIKIKQHTYWLNKANDLAKQLCAFSAKVRRDARRQ